MLICVVQHTRLPKAGQSGLYCTCNFCQVTLQYITWQMSIFTMARALSVDRNLFHVTHRRRSSSLGARITPDRASCILNREKTFCRDCIGCLTTSIRENLDVSRTSDGLPAIGHATCHNFCLELDKTYHTFCLQSEILFVTLY